MRVSARLASAMLGVVLCALPSSSASALIITSSSLFTDNRPADDPFGLPGFRISLQATVSDPLGVPGNISTFIARNRSSSEVIGMGFVAGEQSLFRAIGLLGSVPSGSWAPGAASVRVWEIMSWGWGPRTRRPSPEVPKVAYAPNAPA